MSEIRHATFPLDCDAMNAANQAVFQEMDRRGEPRRKLKMDGTDDEYRELWMNAYIAKGGQYASIPQSRQPGDPVMNCPRKSEAAARQTTLTIVVTDAIDGRPLPGVKVFGVLNGTSNLSGTTDAIGHAHLGTVEPGNYFYSLTKKGWIPATGQHAPVLAETFNIERDTLQSKTNLVIRVVDKRDGTPVPKALVRYALEGNSFSTRRADQDGVAMIIDKPPGTYLFEVSSQCWHTISGRTTLEAGKTTYEYAKLERFLVLEGQRTVTVKKRQFYQQQQILRSPDFDRWIAESEKDCHSLTDAALETDIGATKEQLKQYAKDRKPNGCIMFDVAKKIDVGHVSLEHEVDKEVEMHGMRPVTWTLRLEGTGDATVRFKVYE